MGLGRLVDMGFGILGAGFFGFSGFKICAGFCTTGALTAHLLKAQEKASPIPARIKQGTSVTTARKTKQTLEAIRAHRFVPAASFRLLILLICLKHHLAGSTSGIWLQHVEDARILSIPTGILRLRERGLRV